MESVSLEAPRPNVSVRTLPPDTSIQVEDLKDPRQSILAYNVSHYESVPTVPRGHPLAKPAVRLLGAYPTLQALMDVEEQLLQGCNQFTIRMSDTFRADILCANERMPWNERRRRILRVFDHLRYRFTVQQKNELIRRTMSKHLREWRKLLAKKQGAPTKEDREIFSRHALVIHLQQFNWDLIQALAPDTRRSETARPDIVCDPGARVRVEALKELHLRQDSERRANLETPLEELQVEVAVGDQGIEIPETELPVEGHRGVAAENEEEEEEEDDQRRRELRRARVEKRKTAVQSLDDVPFPTTLELRGQNVCVCTLLEDKEHPLEPVIIPWRMFHSSEETAIKAFMEDVSKLYAPLEVTCVKMYEFGPLDGFDQVLTEKDKEYEKKMRSSNHTTIMASSAEELRERIRREHGINPDDSTVVHFTDGPNLSDLEDSSDEETTTMASEFLEPGEERKTLSPEERELRRQRREERRQRREILIEESRSRSIIKINRASVFDRDEDGNEIEGTRVELGPESVRMVSHAAERAPKTAKDYATQYPLISDEEIEARVRRAKETLGGDQARLLRESLVRENESRQEAYEMMLKSEDSERRAAQATIEAGGNVEAVRSAMSRARKAVIESYKKDRNFVEADLDPQEPQDELAAIEESAAVEAMERGCSTEEVEAAIRAARERHLANAKPENPEEAKQTREIEIGATEL